MKRPDVGVCLAFPAQAVVTAYYKTTEEGRAEAKREGKRRSEEGTGAGLLEMLASLT